MSDKAWLDISIFRCPKCGHYYADASWYAIELESDVECGVCHIVFNPKKNLSDRVMISFKIENGKVKEVRIEEHIQTER